MITKFSTLKEVVMNCDVSEKRHMWKEAEVSQCASNVRRGRLSFLASYLYEYLLARLQRNKTHCKTEERIPPGTDFWASLV